MEHVVRQRLNEIRRKQLESQEIPQTTRPSDSAANKSQHLIALGGVAAGITIAIIVWLAKSILINNDASMISPGAHTAIFSGSIRNTNEHIDQLNGRIELLTESITRLETRLTQVMELTDFITDIEMKYAATMLESRPTSAGNKPTSSTTGPDVTEAAVEVETSFVPTHTVNARLNLRPSMSLDAAPIAVLQVGTKIEYIHEDNEWYYVNTEIHGKGWCASDYLSPLPPEQ